MANHITLYNYNGQNNVIGKTLESGLTFPVSAESILYRSAIDFNFPVVILESNISPAYNYMEIEQDGVTRYYFARVENTRAGLSTITGMKDVLQTFDLSNVTVIVRRTANMNYQCQYIVDDKAPIEAKHRVSQNANFTELAHLSSSMIICTVG